MKTIVWDLDDVLNTLMESWLTLAWGPEHPESRLNYHWLRSNPPLGELQTTQQEYLDSLDRFRLSPAGRNMAPNPLLLEWFERHGSCFAHHVLTARPLNTVAPAAEWVFAHFGRWVRHFHFVPSPRPRQNLPTYDQTKAETLKRLGSVDFFIDDSPENVRQAAGLGIQAFLFPQPWNAAPGSADSILRELARHLPEPNTL